MKLETFSLGDLGANCYLVSDRKEAVVIDPGDEGSFIAEKIYERGLELKAIVATHGHFDHVLGAGELQMIIPAPFYIHKKDEFLLKGANKSAEFWLGERGNNFEPPNHEALFLEPSRSLTEAREANFQQKISPRVEKTTLRDSEKSSGLLLTKISFFKEGDKINFGEYFLEIMETPGHTPGSVCLFLKPVDNSDFDKDFKPIVFTGDTLFEDGVGRTDLSYSSKDDLQKSLKKITKLAPKNAVFCWGHGFVD